MGEQTFVYAAILVDEHDARERFRMAFRTGSLPLIENAARKLSSVSLVDALRILVVMAEKRDERYERAAARWAARAICERHLGLVDGHRILSLVEALPAAPEAIGARLRSYCGP
jgi:hypothetical protein